MSSQTIPKTLEAAMQIHREGRLAEAEAIYRQVLETEPEQPDALHLLGVLAQQAGQHELAVSLINQAISRNRWFPDYYCNLALALYDLGRVDEAIQAYLTAIQVKPNSATAYSNLGRVLQTQGRIDEAIAACRRAIDLKPDSFDAYNTMGNCRMSQGRFDDAVTAYRVTLDLNPNYAEAHSNLGNVLNILGRPGRAESFCRTAIKLKPGLADAHSHLATALKDLGRYDEAAEAYRTAIELRPNDASAHNNLGNVIRYQGDTEGAIARYRHAIQLQPNNAQIHSNLVYTLQFHPAYSALDVRDEAINWRKQHADPHRSERLAHANLPDPARRLRIGYVSPDFRDHVVGRNILPLFRKHDPTQFEVVCYSGVAVPDAITAQFQSLSAGWRDVLRASDDQLAAQIRADGIDILVDLTLHMAANRLPLFARKPAPVQATFAGYPGTTGMDTIDYRLSDSLLDPARSNDDLYTEEIVRLDSFWCFDPLGDDIKVGPLPALKNGHITFGCLNNFSKVNEQVIAAWCRVLAGIKDSRMLMLSPEGRHRGRIWSQFEAAGIDRDRVSFTVQLPRTGYLALHHKIDVILDTFPYTGHSTTLDALWMGVPVVTLAGQSAISRGSLSILSNAGHAELATHTEDNYVRTAIALAGDQSRLTQLRANLRKAMQTSILTDSTRFARNIESAYRMMWERWTRQQGGQS